MVSTQKAPVPVASGSVARSAGRQFGYLVAIAINVVMLWAANNLLDWGVLPFLTEDFRAVLWLINISLVISIAVNATYLGYDRQWYRSLTQAVLNGISLIVTVLLFQVFPFDFTAYQFPWESITRVMLVLVMVGTVAGIAAEFYKLARLAIIE
ncbi:MAG TPA: hypothetical protein VJR05_15275 [Acidimicrobiia bacterium]|nr:hypothetical protein [Acidimicrobiia bacterium]